MTLTYEIERDDRGLIELTIEGDYSPARRGNRGGHPDTWEPDEGAEVEFTFCCEGTRPELTAREIEGIEQAIVDAAGEEYDGHDWEPDYDDERWSYR